MKIKSIEYLFENIKSRRMLRITLNNGVIIKAQKCYESWEQWGGNSDELTLTCLVVDKHNDWLHGGKRPQYEDNN